MPIREQLTERRNRAVLPGVSNLHPLFIAKAKRALLTDVEGREYIDFAGGIGVNNVGHRHPKALAPSWGGSKPTCIPASTS